MIPEMHSVIFRYLSSVIPFSHRPVIRIHTSQCRSLPVFMADHSSLTSSGFAPLSTDLSLSSWPITLLLRHPDSHLSAQISLSSWPITLLLRLPSPCLHGRSLFSYVFRINIASILLNIVCNIILQLVPSIFILHIVERTELARHIIVADDIRLRIQVKPA